ncbi:hypothetical protein Leryth_008957 [Lithospermum erythrorhizon]|nr:hypothetical protein Leryth_008957 [Lithospermum erythrorhizon]
MIQCKACKKTFNSHQALGGHRASHKNVKGCHASRFRDNNVKGCRASRFRDNNFSGDNGEDAMSIPPATGSSQQQPMPTLNGSTTFQLPLTKTASKAHECSICHRVFSSGQALGGHKRCHWLTSNLAENTTFIPDLHHDICYQLIIQTNTKYSKDPSSMLKQDT